MTQEEQNAVSAGTLDYTFTDGWVSPEKLKAIKVIREIVQGVENSNWLGALETLRLYVEAQARPTVTALADCQISINAAHKLLDECGWVGLRDVTHQGLTARLKTLLHHRPSRETVAGYSTAQMIALLTQSTLYAELIYAVARKHEGENRHQTALRYIRQTEQAPQNEALAYIAALWRTNQLPAPMTNSLREAVLGYTCGVTEKKS